MAYSTVLFRNSNAKPKTFAQKVFKLALTVPTDWVTGCVVGWLDGWSEEEAVGKEEEERKQALVDCGMLLAADGRPSG